MDWHPAQRSSRCFSRVSPGKLAGLDTYLAHVPASTPVAPLAYTLSTPVSGPTPPWQLDQGPFSWTAPTRPLPTPNPTRLRFRSVRSGLHAKTSKMHVRACGPGATLNRSRPFWRTAGRALRGSSLAGHHRTAQRTPGPLPGPQWRLSGIVQSSHKHRLLASIGCVVVRLGCDGLIGEGIARCYWLSSLGAPANHDPDIDAVSSRCGLAPPDVPPPFAV